ncbi:hypothetical protein AK830_g8696 [Neonectria ditissima]|uniref:Heterokaryon incompatibility domain-containing protein n=1 Tax=Neonectria ditissima TaxID=78410 RepID=A0A0P7BBL6_9HYPO|nr:hypothetical protein AK830_g8696 [Neonectria ditissima]
MPHSQNPQEQVFRGSSNHILQDYQMQLMLLEKKNKQRLRQEATARPLVVRESDDFPYGTISQSRGLTEIRLLRGLPTNGSSDLIEYDLSSFSFRNCPDYVALSYVWGTDEAGSLITVNGRRLSVRSNLLAALKQMRDDLDHTTYIWIDAICIDQSNMDEKSYVVRHMGAIFQRARHIYAWLGGPLYDTTDTCGNDLVDQLRTIGDLFWSQAPKDDQIKNDVMNDIMIKCLPATMEMFGKPMDDGGFLVLAYKDLCVRQYWTRTWVLQEVHLAMELSFHVGARSIPLKTLAGALALLQAFQKHLLATVSSEQPRYNHLIDFFTTHVSPFTQMHRLVIYTSLYPPEIGSLRIAMTNFCIKDAHGGTRATDPRDMIYGLLGFATDSEREYIQPIYSLTVGDAYQTTTQAFLTNGWTDVLAWAQGHNKTLQQLPTWTPDYSATIHETICSKSQAKHWLPRFKVSGDSVVNARGIAWTSSVISFTGFSVDKIAVVGATSPCPSKATPGKMEGVSCNEILRFLEEAQLLCREAESMTTRSKPGMNRTARHEASWRVPVADQIVLQSGVFRSQTGLFELYQKTLEALRLSSDYGVPIPEDVRPYIEGMLLHKTRRLFVTETGLVGLGPLGMEQGDRLVVFYGFQAPYVIRPASNSRFALVGEAFVNGIMDGELLELDVSPEAEVFSLV